MANQARQRLGLVCCIGFLFATAFAAASPALAAGAQYVDCAASPSGANGSQLHPWATLGDASAQPLTPGSELLLKRGTSCTGTLEPTGSGSSSAPARIGAYGSGPLPRIISGGEDAVRLENTSHTVLEDLEITNPGDNSDKRRGVHLLATGQTVTGLTARGLEIHDVGGNLDKDRGGSGGIQVDASGPGVGRFDGLSIESNTIEEVSRSGIFMVGASAGDRPRAGEPWPEASINVRIAGNRIAHIAGDGIVTLGTDGALVSGNVVSDGNRAGRPPGDPQGAICNAGIWAFGANRTTIERNEVFGMNFNGCDGAGFDIDRAQDGTVVQYNYSHDNGGGFLLLCTDNEPRAAWARFNLSVDDEFMLHSVPCVSNGSVSGIEIYNNTIVAPNPGLAKLGTPSTELHGPPSLNFFNNLLSATGPASGFKCEPACHHNLFSGLPPAGTEYVIGDPHFLDPSRRGTPETPQGFQLLIGSAALGAGAAIPAGVAADYFGHPIDRSLAANIGFDQARPVIGPLLGNLALRPRRFQAAPGRGASIASAGGAKLRFQLDSAATVNFQVVRVRRSGKGSRIVGGFRLAGLPGLNSRRFTGRVRHRPLRPGRYLLRAVAGNAGGTSRGLEAGFRVLSPG